MHPKDLQILDYSYELPVERIARYPLEQRDQSKLLVYRFDEFSVTAYADLADQLPSNSLLVFNNTKVVEARILFQKPGGSLIEIFCLEPHEQYPDMTSAMLEKGSVVWKCLVGGAKKWKAGPLEKIISHSISGSAAKLHLLAGKLEQCNDCYHIQFSWSDAALSFAEVLHLAGSIPLPPYLNRAPEESDSERYQTIYAAHDGSVAAPTAGLHFTETLFHSLAAKNILHEFVTLHVGAGTFKPVKATTMQYHDMHAEWIDVSLGFLQKLAAHVPNTIIPVGTTSLRTLESIYWLGIKTRLDPRIPPAELGLTQWEPYELQNAETNAVQALQALITWMQHHNQTRLLTKTQIIIAPGYQFRIIHALITNFHQPQSTLLLLVAALIGEDWKKVYNYALQNEFRFLSYGDGCLLWGGNKK